MAKRKPIVPIMAFAYEEGASSYSLHLTQSNWARIENAAGLCLSDSLKTEIESWSRDFLILDYVESKSLPVLAIRKRLQTLRASAIKFLSTLTEHESDYPLFSGPPVRFPGAAPRSVEAIAAALIDGHISNPAHLVRAIRFQLPSALRGYIDACDAGLVSLQQARKPCQVGARNDSWRMWVRDIARVLQSEGLPVSARQDTDKNSGEASPFVCVLWELQTLFPKESRQHMQSKSALAQAINAVLGSDRKRNRSAKDPQRAP